MTREDKSREFRCEAVGGRDVIMLMTRNSDTRLEFNWMGSAGKNVYLGRDTCVRLIGQLRSFVDSGHLLSVPEPKPTTTAKATAKALLEAVGLEVDLDQIRVTQGRRINSEHD